MNVLVNGEPRDLPDGSAVTALVEGRRGVAVAVNGAVVRAADWASTTLRPDDRVEVVTAHQGG
jgi:sulfur carrier protein